MKRKAQSEIITTFALILIVLAAIAIVWLIVNSLMPKKDPFRCSDINLRIVEARSTNDIINTGDYGAIEIQRKTGGEGLIKSVKIIIDGQPATIQYVNSIDFPCSDDDPLLPPNQLYESIGDPADLTTYELDNNIPECEEVNNGRTALSLEQIETKTYFVPSDNDDSDGYTPGTIHQESVVEIAAIIESDGVEEVCNVVDKKIAM